MKIQLTFVARWLALGMCCALLSAVQAQHIQSKRLYVSTSGSDNNRGSKNSPFATIEAAIHTVKRWREASNPIGAEIVLAGGKYHLEKPIEISATISNSKTQPLSIKAEDGEQVVLSGARLLTLKWKNMGQGVWKAKVPNGLHFQSLYADEKKLIRARYPNFEAGILPFNGYAADAVSPERVAGWKHPAGGIVHALHQGRWGGFHYRIVGKEGSSKILLEGGQQNNRPSKMHETYRFVENIFEELDTAGEWYLDEQTANLYYMPEQGTNPNEMKFEAPVLENLLSISGDTIQPVYGVTIQRIQFEHTAPTFMKTAEPLLRSDWTIYRQGAIKIEGAEHCFISENDFYELGGNAIFVSNYNRAVKISGNRIVQIGGGGINFVGDSQAVRSPVFQYSQFVPLDQMDKSKGPKSTNYPKDCEASDNLIHDIGLIEKQVAGVQISMSESLRVLNNTIYNVPRAGINIGDGTWGGHEIAYNDVFNTVLETSDHGAFNSWGRDRFWHPDRKKMDELTQKHPELILLDAMKTTKIHGNRFRCDHGWDIDLDDGSSNYEIYNNLCLSGGLKLREGFYRKVYNNIMINNGFHPHVWFQNSHDVFRDNLVMQSHQDIQVKYWGDMVDYSIYEQNEDLKKDQSKGIEEHGRVITYQFIDPIHGDFRLKGWSNQGFKNFDMQHMGVTSPRLKACAIHPEIPQLRRKETNITSETWKWNGGLFKSVETLGEQSAAGLPSISGVLVVNVEEKSNLYQGGLRSGDVILNYQSENINNLNDLQLILKKIPYVNQPKLTIFRNQQQQVLILQL